MFVFAGNRKTKRNYGFHPFQGRKDANVIATYILHHTRPGDLILDAFAGSGTTAREALHHRRRVISVDVNAVSELITRASVVAVPPHELQRGFHDLESSVAARILAISDPESAEEQLAHHDLSFLEQEIPRVIRRGAKRGFTRLRDLHDPRQTLALLYLRAGIAAEEDDDVRLVLRAAFSHTLKYATKMYAAGANRSYWAGNAAPFRNLAYQVPTNWDYRNVWEIFQHVFANVLEAKRETYRLIGPFALEGETYWFIRSSVGDLPAQMDGLGLPTEHVFDYAIADPPYAEVIQYPLLYTLWYAWLELPAPNLDDDLTVVGYVAEAKRPEAQATFLGKMDGAIGAIAETIKPGAWLTLFYQHQNLRYWAPIVESARNHELHYENLVPQPQQVKSFAQLKNPFETLAGNLIVNFRKGFSGRNVQLGHRNPVLFPSLVKFAELELQRIIVEHLGADTETLGFHLISVLLDPTLMSERLPEALRVVDLLRTQELESLGAVFANSTENLWMLKDGAEIDDLIDPYDQLRYRLFAYLRRVRRATTGQLNTEALRTMAECSLSIGSTTTKDIVAEFAEFAAGGWNYSPEQRQRSILPRLLLARSSADKLRPVFFSDERNLLRVNVAGISHLRALYASSPAGYQELHNVLVAALSEIRDRFSDRVHGVYAIEELASGDLDISEVQLVDIPLLLVAPGSDEDRYDLEQTITAEVFAPLYVHSGVMLLSTARAEPSGLAEGRRMIPLLSSR